jgi:hypothetical protein
MKKIFKTAMLAALAMFLITACEPQEIDDYDLGAAPTAEDLNFTMEPSVESPNIIQFTNTSSVPGVALWDFGNGSEGKGQMPKAQYPLQGSYEIKMTLATSGGIASISKMLEIEGNDMSLFDHPLYTKLTGGIDALEGKTWVVDQYAAGALGVGPADSDNPDWWEDTANGKAGSSFYEQKYTFKQVGVEMIWENQGYIYTNQAGADALAAKGYTDATLNPDVGDFDVAYQPNDSYTFALNISEMTLTLSDEAFISFYTGSSTYEILSIDEERMYLRNQSVVEPGNVWYVKLVVEELNIEPDEPDEPDEPEPTPDLLEVPLFEDFEDQEFDVLFDGQDMGDLTSYSIENPASDDVNTSSNVVLYQKKAGTFYSNMFFVADEYKFDLSNQNQITLKVYIPSDNDYETENNVAGNWITNTKLLPSLAVKLQNNEKGESAWETQTEIVKNDIVMDEWIELNFDFSDVADREDYDKIVIQFGMEGHDGGGVFYFDDFSFH